MYASFFGDIYQPSHPPPLCCTRCLGEGVLSSSLCPTEAPNHCSYFSRNEYPLSPKRWLVARASVFVSPIFAPSRSALCTIPFFFFFFHSASVRVFGNKKALALLTLFVCIYSLHPCDKQQHKQSLFTPAQWVIFPPALRPILGPQDTSRALLASHSQPSLRRSAGVDAGAGGSHGSLCPSLRVHKTTAVQHRSRIHDMRTRQYKYIA